MANAEDSRRQKGKKSLISLHFKDICEDKWKSTGSRLLEL